MSKGSVLERSKKDAIVYEDLGWFKWMFVTISAIMFVISAPILPLVFVMFIIGIISAEDPGAVVQNIIGSILLLVMALFMFAMLFIVALIPFLTVRVAVFDDGVHAGWIPLKYVF